MIWVVIALGNVVNYQFIHITLTSTLDYIIVIYFRCRFIFSIFLQVEIHNGIFLLRTPSGPHQVS